MYDLIIIGGGPAGLTAGVYALQKRMETLIIAQELGGKARYSFQLDAMEGHEIITGYQRGRDQDGHRSSGALCNPTHEYDGILHAAPVGDHGKAGALDHPALGDALQHFLGRPHEPRDADEAAILLGLDLAVSRQAAVRAVRHTPIGVREQEVDAGHPRSAVESRRGKPQLHRSGEAELNVLRALRSLFHRLLPSVCFNDELKDRRSI